MAMSTGQKGAYLCDINITPFVDVMLVLLIIFMVTAPMMTQGLEVDLPQTKTVTTLPKDSDNIVLTIKKDGSLYLDEYPINMEDLAGHVRRLVTDQKKLMFLRADKEVAYGTVVRVMGLLKGSGVDKLGIVAEPDKDESPTRPKK